MEVDGAPTPIRSAVILVESGKVALIERRRQGKCYYLFPGGQVEGGEPLEAAAIREAKEELGVDVEIDQLVARSVFGDAEQYYFLAHAVGGTFGAGDGIELQSGEETARGSYVPVWESVASLNAKDVRPHSLASALIDGSLGRKSDVMQLFD